jgi:hypothetical protein
MLKMLAIVNVTTLDVLKEYNNIKLMYFKLIN